MVMRLFKGKHAPTRPPCPLDQLDFKMVFALQSSHAHPINISPSQAPTGAQRDGVLEPLAARIYNNHLWEAKGKRRRERSVCYLEQIRITVHQAASGAILRKTD